MNPVDRFDPNLETPREFMDRLLAEHRAREREQERREAIRRNAAIAKIRQEKAAEAARVVKKPNNQSHPIVGPKHQLGGGVIGSGSTVSTPTPTPNTDPFGLDTLRYHLAEAKKEAQKLQAAADAVLAIHTKVEDKREGREFYCGHCSTAYPCVTVEALLGDEE